MPKECLRCQSEFTPRLADEERGRAKFCSVICANRYRSENCPPLPDNVQCRNCGTSFHKPPSKMALSKSGLFFCSRKCKDYSQTLAAGVKEIQPPHFGCGIGSYREIARRHHDNRCGRCQYDKELGILLVHHKDRDRSNNSPENLEILCPNCHAIDHLLAKDGCFTGFKKSGV